jgi:uncharacterized protein YjiS (DUF1127 family)
MATITIGGVHAGAERKRGFLARVLDRMGEAQLQRARSIAKPHLLALDDEELRKLGYTRDEIRRWPSGAHWV